MRELDLQPPMVVTLMKGTANGDRCEWKQMLDHGWAWEKEKIEIPR